MTLRTAHLAEDDLLSLCLDSAEANRSSLLQHVDVCTECASRWDTLKQLLDAIQDDLQVNADDVWTVDRLAHQRDQIRRRLESAGRLARVIAFPAGSRSRRIDRPGARVAMRWVAAAAVLGLLVGVGAGVLLDHRSHDIVALSIDRIAGGATVLRSRPSSPQSSMATSSEDQFLSDVEAAVEAGRAPELQALDDFTPRIQEVAMNLK